MKWLIDALTKEGQSHNDNNHGTIVDQGAECMSANFKLTNILLT